VHEISFFGILAGVTVAAGLVIRISSHRDDMRYTLDTWDLGRELFAASAAVIPTALIVESRPFGHEQVLAIVVVFAIILLWGRGESRYFSLWREGKARPVEGNQLGDPIDIPESTAKRKRMAAFLLSNGLGFVVLFAATALTGNFGS